ncbi:MAG: type I-F CRISPR-associated protein Csy1 [Chlamydiae bacterium]|nr:type I-F CRISPR-associated protein Csy1 [Chlamydiota bacterium]
MNEFSLAIQKFFKEKKGSELEDLLGVGAEIEKASKNASKIELASHVMKFSHSSSDGSNILCEPGDAESNAEMKHYISSETLTNRKLDIAYKSAGFSRAASLVMLEVGGETLRDCLLRGDSSPLEPFAESSDQLKSWMECFTKIEPKKLPSAHKAKQIFFPLDDGSYHLLAPLFSSSLCHYFYEEINSEEAKEARRRKKDKEFCEHGFKAFKRMAKIVIGGSQPQNVSFLNSKRGGTVYLFNAEPPEWKDLKKPPLTEKIFWWNFRRFSTIDFEKYTKFLEEEKENNLEIRKKSHDFRFRIYQALLEYVENIYGFEPGWSENSSLSIAFKLWLDPLNEEFEAVDSAFNWKEIIAEEFSIIFYEILCDFGFKLDSSNRQFIKREFLDEFRRRFRS